MSPAQVLESKTRLPDLRQASRSLSIVIPCFNEASRLPATLESLQSFLHQRPYKTEVIVVDDGSRDDTFARAQAFQARMPQLRVLGYSANRGKGFAVRTGVLAARHETILFSDADLSTPISEVDRFWSWYDQGWEVLVGSRHLPQARLLVRQPTHRRLMGRIFNLVISLIGVRGFRDTQCGFKLFRAEAAKALFANLRTDGFAFDVEILMEARRRRFKSAEIPVRWTDAPGTRVHLVRDSVRMILEILRMRGFV